MAYHLPASWVIHEYKGSEDYGLDFHVEVFEDGNPTGLEFGVQVKTKSKPLSEMSQFSVSRNNLTYIAAKPYPTMAVMVSRQDNDAVFVWFPNILSDETILGALRDSNTPKKIHIPVQAPEQFIGAADRITAFLKRHADQVDRWLGTTAHTHLMVNLYLDIHAALDVLIESDALLHQRGQPDDEISHKLTFSFITTITAYGCLYGLTRPDRVQVFGPLMPTMIGLRSSFRQILSGMIPEEFLIDYESRGNGESDVCIIPARYSAFPLAIPRLLCVVRDVLRTVSRFMAPSRDFTKEMSGMAALVIDYKSPMQRSAEQQHTADDAVRRAEPER